MKCESCNINEATIHLTQVVNGVVKKVHICQECAGKNGLDLSSPISITDILLGLGGTQESEPDLPFDQSCPVCHMRRNDFKKTGRLGCPDCYDNFMGEINSLIGAMHHSTQHTGKLPARAGSKLRQQAEIATLRQQMEGAIVQEDFETAARLRDQIRAIQSSDEGEA
jgi:protein arginine kinase activator